MAHIGMKYPVAATFLFGVPVKLIAIARTNPSAYLFPSVYVAATGYFIPICEGWCRTIRGRSAYRGYILNADSLFPAIN